MKEGIIAHDFTVRSQLIKIVFFFL